MSHTDCLFCKIVKGQIPSVNVYETGEVLAFLDIAPVAPGHILIIPKAHYDTLFDVPEGLGAELLTAQKLVARAILEATGATGINVQMNNFPSAGQVVPHAHLHLIPRRDGDGLSLWPGTPYADETAMATQAAAIRRVLDGSR